ncbi:MAG: alpha/beta hydrolase [Pyrinomonadaceae bacterium]
MNSQDNTLETDLNVTAEIKLYYDLHVPAGARNAPLLIAVHGYGAHKRYMMREARSVVPEDWLVASIQAPHPHYRQTTDGYRVGFGWLSDHKPEDDVRLHQKFVLDVIDKLDGEGRIDRDRIYLYGFSQACALNFRFAFTYPDLLRGIIGVCGGIPGDLETNAAYKPFTAETLYLYGDDDEFYTQDQFATFNDKLRSRLPNYRSKHYTAKHEITDEMREDIRSFLTQ